MGIGLEQIEPRVRREFVKTPERGTHDTYAYL
jgi:hypothetical protein